MNATTTTTVTPVITPKPSQTPWTEQFTDPFRICDQQVRECSSPDVQP